MKFICREILCSGDGPPGPEKVVNPAYPELYDAAQAAECFAGDLVEAERKEQGMDDEDCFDGNIYDVEVRTTDAEPWTKFRVFVSVKLVFEAQVMT
jgi:hypothetical protein